MKLKKTFSPKWKHWIKSNLKKGVDKTYIFNLLLENNFDYDSVISEMKFEPKLKQTFSYEWERWLDENLSNNQNKDGLFKILLMHGFSFDAIKEQMQYEPSMPLDKLVDPFKLIRNNLTTDSKSIEKYPNEIKQLVLLNATKIKTDKLQIFSIDNFLDSNECEYLIDTICAKLRPSELSTPDADKFFRTSKTCDLAEFNDKVIQNIDQRICNLLQINKDLSEPIQGQYYEVGQEFKPHTDTFEDYELIDHGGALGQRSYTVMIYLNSTEKGGETTFPLINKEFYPIEGKAIIWHNLNPDFSPNKYSMHHAKQVRKGFKAVITKWFRTGIPIPS